MPEAQFKILLRQHNSLFPLLHFGRYLNKINEEKRLFLGDIRTNPKYGRDLMQDVISSIHWEGNMESSRWNFNIHLFSFFFFNKHLTDKELLRACGDVKSSLGWLISTPWAAHSWWVLKISRWVSSPVWPRFELVSNLVRRLLISLNKSNFTAPSQGIRYDRIAVGWYWDYRSVG